MAGKSKQTVALIIRQTDHEWVCGFQMSLSLALRMNLRSRPDSSMTAPMTGTTISQESL